jgi:hypothetical protein
MLKLQLPEALCVARTYSVLRDPISLYFYTQGLVILYHHLLWRICESKL